MNEVLKALKERRSYRRFTDEEVPDDVLAQILEAGTYAPTGMGMQSPKMVVVKKGETFEKIREMNMSVMGSDKDPFYGASLMVIVLADTNRSTYIEDGSLVMGNLMLAAHSLGVASCWIHRARQEFESPEGKELLKEWGISDNYAGIGHCILGYSDAEPRAALPRKEDYVTFA